MASILLTFAVLLFACILLNHMGGKAGLPSLLLFICLGMAASALGIAPGFRSFSLANGFSCIGLIFIMFYGGFGTSWKKARKTAKPAVLLSSLGVILTALLVMLFCHFALAMDWLPSLLLGSVISSTDAASVFSILRSHHLNLRYGTASMLELESGSNDPCANIMVILTLALMRGEATAGSTAALFIKQFVLGLLLGFAAAYGAVWLMQHVPSAGGDGGSVFIIAVAIFSYAAAECLGGNGYLSVYITGIVMGNSAIPNRKPLTHFFDGLTGLMQVMIFFLLGLISTPSLLLKCLFPGLLTALFLTMVARPVVVLAILAPFKAPRHQRLLVDWCGLRGASAIVFAIVAALDPATGTATDSILFHTVFFIVLFSILIQGSLIPFVAKKLKMLDDREDVMKTFSDWSEDVPLSFIQIRITAEHPWLNKLMLEVRPSLVLGGGRVVCVIRDGKQITPRGNTRLCEGDIMVVSGESLDGKAWGCLNELPITKDHPWAGKRVRDLNIDEGCTLVAIRRDGQLLIPEGSTLICAGDQIVVNENT